MTPAQFYSAALMLGYDRRSAALIEISEVMQIVKLRDTKKGKKDDGWNS